MKNVASMLAAFLVSMAAAAPADEARERQIAAAAKSLDAKLIETRRDLHMHPELSNREERTAGMVAKRLRELGFDQVRTGVARHGVVGVLKGDKPGAVVAVRADMDALPIQEAGNAPYKSKNAGVAHACGHDVHTAIALGVAEVLSTMRDRIPGSIKFVFQPAEEGAPAGEEGGAKLMVEEGALENPRPLAIFGLHTMPAIEVGQIAYHSGAAMASSDRVTIVIHGKKSHGAQPQMGVDAIVVAAECVTALQTVRSRRTDPLEPMVLSIGTIDGGDRNNIVADRVTMTGTLRALSEETRKQAHAMIRETLAGVTSTYGATFDLQFDNALPVTYNDPALVEETLPTIRRVVGAENVIAPRPLMPAEDFSYYQRVVPGFYYFLGVGNTARGITAAWHTAEFDVDEASLQVGVNVMANVLLDYLERRAK